MELRRYFIMDRVSDDEFEALESCIGKNWTQRYSLDFTQLLIKTNDKILSPFSNSTEYTYEEIKAITQTPKWEEKKNNLKLT